MQKCIICLIYQVFNQPINEAVVRQIISTEQSISPAKPGASKSRLTITTLFPIRAKCQAQSAKAVVLPTPPLILNATAVGKGGDSGRGSLSQSWLVRSRLIGLSVWTDLDSVR